MSFSATIPVANIASANSTLQLAGFGPNNFTIPLWTSGPLPAFAAMFCLANIPGFQAACAALPGVTIRTYGTLAKGMNDTATAVSGRWGGSAPILQGNVTPGLYRASPADGGALWWVIQSFNRTTFNLPLNTPTNPYPALLTQARTPGEVTIWVQPLGAPDSYHAVNAFTGLPDRVTHLGKMWDSLIATNVNVPGTANWREYVESGYPAWLAPTGAGDAYPVGFRVRHLGQNWQNNNPANVFEPGIAGWSVIP